MFATLLGALPRPVRAGDSSPTDLDDLDPLIQVAVRAQEDAGHEPITDGRLRDPGFDRLAELLLAPDPAAAVALVVDGWRATAALTERATKQALPGPLSVGLRGGESGRDARTHVAADGLAAITAALSDAGCPLVELEEPGPQRLADDGELNLFLDAHRRLAEGSHVSEIHRSLSFVGGSAPQAAIDAILELPYASLAVDLIAGPDSWYLVRRAPRDRGIVAGVQSGNEQDEAKEVMHWAAHYAASSGGRGMDRVGLGSAGSWTSLPWDAAVRKLHALGNAARLAAMPPGEDLARQLDPKAVSSRRAAVGHDVPRPRRSR